MRDGCPVQPGLPVLPLTGRECGRMGGAIAQQIALRVLRQCRSDRAGVGCHAVLRGAGQAGQRQVVQCERPASGTAGRLPLGRDGVSQGGCGQQQRRAAGDTHGLTVQQDRGTAGHVSDGGGGPETLHRSRLRSRSAGLVDLGGSGAGGIAPGRPLRASVSAGPH